MAENRWVTGVFSPQSMEFYGALQDGSSVAPARPLAPMEPRGPTATSGGRSIFGGPCLQGILPCGHMCMYIYIYIYLETHVAILFLSKRIYHNMLKKYRFITGERLYAHQIQDHIRIGHFLGHYGVYPE